MKGIHIMVFIVALETGDYEWNVYVWEIFLCFETIRTVAPNWISKIV
jgi:hypothetical protein